MRAIYPPDVENELKEAFFQDNACGYFVEVGANDPEQLSQTFHLEELGWTGVLVEPQPELATQLAARRKCKVYPVACSSPENAGRTLTLYLAGIHSSFDPNLKLATKRAVGAIQVVVRTLDDILEDAGAPSPLDFLSIDVEGHEIEVLEGFDFARRMPRLLLIEDLAMDLRQHRYLTAREYRWFRRTGLNNWYVPASSPPRADLQGRLEFFRKYYLGKPFRHWREASRRVRLKLREGRRR